MTNVIPGCLANVVQARELIASGAIKERGVLFPEQLFAGEHYEAFVAELSQKGVLITHDQEPGPTT